MTTLLKAAAQLGHFYCEFFGSWQTDVDAVSDLLIYMEPETIVSEMLLFREYVFDPDLARDLRAELELDDQAN